MTPQPTLTEILTIDTWMDETYTLLFTPDEWRVVQGMQDGFGEERVPLENCEL